MKMLAKIDKKYLWIGSAVLLVLTVLCAGVFLATRPSQTSTSARLPQTLLAQATQQLRATPTMVASPAPTSSKPPLVTGSSWAVYQIVYLEYESDGYRYDVATFTNLETGETLTANCAEPNWPSPPLGSKYTLNSAGVLIPVTEDVYHPFQRFILLEY